MGNDNNKNVLDFLKDEDNDNSNKKKHKVTLKNKKTNRMAFSIFAILIFMLLVFSYLIKGIRDEPTSRKINNSNSSESDIRTNYDSNNSSNKTTSDKLEINSYEVNVVLYDGSLFFVDENISINHISEKYGIVLSRPNLYENTYLQIADIVMKADDMETSTYEEEDNTYFQFGNKNKVISGKKTYNLSYVYDYSKIMLQDIKFVFIDKWEYPISNIKVNLTLNNVDYQNYQYKFSPEMNCTNNANVLSCSLNHLDKDKQVSVEFNRLNNSFDSENSSNYDGVIYSSSN